MPLFENASCPVCNRQFEEGDDIVYCPDCGTPHHRACYAAVGHCVNRGLHASGYSYYNEISQPDKNKNVEESEKENPFNPFIFSDSAQTDSIYEKDEQKIDGESVADYASAIRTNIPRFINLFKEFESKKRKASWNWGAFFFGSLYLFFRKMYKHGIAFFSAFIAVIYASVFAIGKLAPNYVEAAKNFADLYAQNKLTNEDLIALSKISDLPKANMILYIALGVILLLRIIMALYADKFYKSTISEFIKNVNKQLNDGAAFIQAPMFPSQSVDMDQKQMKKYYLARRGGTSIFLPLLVASTAYFLISMASYTIFN
jgi:hypothetical protein